MLLGAEEDFLKTSRSCRDSAAQKAFHKMTHKAYIAIGKIISLQVLIANLLDLVFDFVAHFATEDNRSPLYLAIVIDVAVIVSVLGHYALGIKNLRAAQLFGSV